jgi:hypothetical protein
MTFLPVVERELRVAARRRATPWVRVAAAAVALGVTAWFVSVDRRSSRAVGGDLFVVLTVILFLYAGLFATQVTADCISEEKREGTLGLLFLTDLKGYDVVFGKLAATSLHWFYGMLAVVPVMALTFILGGVTSGELWRVVLVLVNLLFFSLSVGLWSSTICRKGNRAHGLAWIAILVIFFAWPAAAHLRRHPNPDTRVADLSSPANGCLLAFDGAYFHRHLDFWLNAGITQVYTWSFLAWACWVTPRCWQDAVIGKSPWWRSLRFSSRRSMRRPTLLTLNPFLWRATRVGFGRVAIWVMLGVVAAIWLWLYRLFLNAARGEVDFAPPLNIAFLVAAGLVVKGGVAAESGRALGEDRRSGALELILGTRMRPQDVVKGQQRALWRQFAFPIGALLAANFLCLAREWPEMRRWGENERTYVVSIHFIVGVFLVLDSIALSWVGMWHGFIARKPNRSASPAMFRIVVLPGLLFFLLLTLIGSGPGEVSGSVLLAFWCLFGLGADLAASLSRGELLRRFRTIASEGYAGFWASDLRRRIFPESAEVL